MSTLAGALAELDAAIERQRNHEVLAEEAERLSGSLREFTYAAWPHLGYPALPRPVWHIDAITEHVQAAYEREITRLAVSIQPGSFKSTSVTVLAPAWRWARTPSERFVTGSHADHLATRDATKSRTLMQGAWFQARWSDVFDFAEAENLKTRYSNTAGGHRVRTHVGGGTGDRGTVLQLDDPHNAKEARYADTQLQDAIEWWADTWVSRLDDTVEHPGTMIVIGQRLHERDLIGYLLSSAPERWTHLCLPTRYEPQHMFVYPAERELPSGRVIPGDPRTTEGELLMPELQDEERLADRVAEDGVTAMVFAGQYQQRPAPREGTIILRRHWRYYPADHLEGSPAEVGNRFHGIRAVVVSADTSFKEKTTSDYVAIGLWAMHPARRYLIRVEHGHFGLTAAKEKMRELREYGMRCWPNVPVFVLVENRANGPEIIDQLKQEIPGVVPDNPSLDKVARAIACESDFESGSVFVAGMMNDTGTGPHPSTPSWAQDVIEECAVFPRGDHDDRVDMVTMGLNWFRGRSVGGSTSSVAKARAELPSAARARVPSATAGTLRR